jgi:PBP1b-binding outer membrane lipoprotein LpoB
MKTSFIALLSIVMFLGACSNGQKTGDTKKSDTLTAVDTPKLDTVKEDTITASKPKRETDEERDMKRMNDIVKKRKTMK